MNDMLFKKFLEEMGLNNIANLSFWLTYYGIGKLLAEFEAWLTNWNWLRSENEIDEDTETVDETIDTALEAAEKDVKALATEIALKDNSYETVWNDGAKFALKKVKEHLDE